MKINKLSMAMMAAASLLAASPAVYAQTNNAGGGATPPPRGQRMTVDQRLEALNKELTLTDEQKPKVKAAMEEQNTAMMAARDITDTTERQAKGRAAREEYMKKMKEILTPEQYTKFQAMPQQGRRGGGGGAGGAGGTTNKP